MATLSGLCDLSENIPFGFTEGLDQNASVGDKNSCEGEVNDGKKGDKNDGNIKRCMVMKCRAEKDMKWKYVCLVALIAYIFFVFYMAVLSRGVAKQSCIKTDLLQCYLQPSGISHRDVLVNIVGRRVCLMWMIYSIMLLGL